MLKFLGMLFGWWFALVGCCVIGGTVFRLVV
jgi:hypothetical protein